MFLSTMWEKNSEVYIVVHFAPAKRGLPPPFPVLDWRFVALTLHAGEI